MYKDLQENLILAIPVFILGALCSLILVVSFPEAYFENDMLGMRNWSIYWRESWRDIYRLCDKCNYPFFGTLVYAGIPAWLGVSEDFSGGLFQYQVFLALVDGLNVVLTYFILRLLNVRGALLWAGIIGLLPSSWAGAALWGQIDNVVQFFLLAALAWVVFNSRQPAALYRDHFSVYVAIAAFLMTIALLTKQLSTFSVFALALMLLASMIVYAQKWQQVATNLILSVLVFLAINTMIDIAINDRSPYISHYLYILQTGNWSIDSISGNGFNIWMFLGRDMWSSAKVPFFLFLTPRGVGIFLFLAYLVSLTLALVLWFARSERTASSVLGREMLLVFIFYLALVNLGFNVLLSGTHERYLFHFYPFALMFFLGIREDNSVFTVRNLSVGILVMCAAAYGLFVRTRDAHLIVGIIHLGLLIYLTTLFFITTAFARNLSNARQGGLLKSFSVRGK